MKTQWYFYKEPYLFSIDLLDWGLGGSLGWDKYASKIKFDLCIGPFSFSISWD